MGASHRLLAVSGSILLFLFLWEQVQATRSGYEAGRARFELRRQRDRISYLRLEAESLNSPEAVAERARQRLGMAPARPEYVYVLGSGERTSPVQPRTSPDWLSSRRPPAAPLPGATIALAH